MNRPSGDSLSPGVLIPRVLIGVSIVLLVYFTWTTHKFSGLYGDSFLDPNNLALTRGPWAEEEYYRFGELDYEGRDPFEGMELPGEAAGTPTAASIEFEFQEKTPILNQN